jgi:hypothetical protein
LCNLFLAFRLGLSLSNPQSPKKFEYSIGGTGDVQISLGLKLSYDPDFLVWAVMRHLRGETWNNSSRGLARFTAQRRLLAYKRIIGEAHQSRELTQFEKRKRLRLGASVSVEYDGVKWRGVYVGLPGEDFDENFGSESEDSEVDITGTDDNTDQRIVVTFGDNSSYVVDLREGGFLVLDGDAAAVAAAPAPESTLLEASSSSSSSSASDLTGKKRKREGSPPTTRKKAR